MIKHKVKKAKGNRTLQLFMVWYKHSFMKMISVILLTDIQTNTQTGPKA